MGRIKAMAVAPYEGLLELIHNVAKKYPDLEVSGVVGDLSEGLLAARHAEEQGYDVIISRGGTYEMIEKEVSIPVVNIEVSGYDYLRAIKLAESYSGRSAFVGFSSITTGALSVNDLLQTDIKIVTIKDRLEALPMLEHLKEEGYSLIIGDVVTVSATASLGINGLLLTSGEESVEKAFEDTIKICSHIKNYKRRYKFLDQVLEETYEMVYIFNERKELIYSNLKDKSNSTILDKLKDYIVPVLEGREQPILLELGYERLICKCTKIEDKRKKKCVSFYCQTLSKNKKTIKGVTFYDPDHQEQTVSTNFVKGNVFAKSVLDQAVAYGNTNQSILIVGEYGVGKEMLSGHVYKNSDDTSSTYVILDCGIMRPEDWEEVFLLFPTLFYDQVNVTLCLKNIHLLSLDLQKEILNVIKNGKGNERIISTSITDLLNEVKKGSFSKELYDLVSQLKIQLPNLKDRMNEFKDFCSLYIIDANAQLGKQVIQLEEEALELLKIQSWDYNFDQLRATMNLLVANAKGLHITKDEVIETLKSPELKMTKPLGAFNYQQTLDEMIADIIRVVLAENEGNIIETAQHLGMSRTTLWRKMKEYQIVYDK